MKRLKNDNPEKIIKFLDQVRFCCENSDLVKTNFGILCKRFRMGSGSAKYALIQSGAIEIKGPGFKNWHWRRTGHLNHAERWDLALTFRKHVAEYNDRLKQCRSLKKINDDLRPTHLTAAKWAKENRSTVFDFTPIQKKQAELPLLEKHAPAITLSHINLIPKILENQERILRILEGNEKGGPQYVGS